ncbi:MAG TPA: hypothetical protein VLL08_09490 [Kineosporiaceae bacterium]|nr:hypothetical protein [Kineosporiaceae bacterium]
MRWRPLAALSALQVTETLHVYPHSPEDFGRSADLAEALARLEAATRLRDGEAVARILNGLSSSEDGQWLLRQCVAAGLREVAAVIADTGPPVAGQSAGAA